jgi:hypothetical protein
LFKIAKQKVCVEVVDKPLGEWNPPWRFATVLLEGDDFKATPAFVSKLMREASESSASRVVMSLPDGGLILGLLNQRRFWTRSRARLCALHIAREYVRDGFQITRDLANVLVVPNTRTGLGQPTALSCVIESPSKDCQGLYLTTHQRLFSWPDNRPATPIDLYHSWHNC